MDFAVIDIEWLNGPIENIVQLGAIMYDENFKEKRRFYRVLKPCKYKEKDISFMHLTTDDIEAGVDFRTAFRKFRHWLGKCRNFIVWSEQSRIRLEAIMRKYATCHFVRVTALQEEYKNFFCCFSFDRICELCGIALKKPLHIAINDCEYLGKVFKIVHNTKLTRKKRAISTHLEKSEHCTLSGSNTYHKNSCRYIKGKSGENKIAIINSVHADVLGLKPCKCCNPDQAELIPVPPIEWYEDDIEKFCEILNLRCEIFFNTIYIYTDISAWYFRRNTSKIRLNHQNMYLNHNGHHKCKSDFHSQKAIFEDPMDAIWYIYKHDKYKFPRQQGGNNERIS